MNTKEDILKNKFFVSLQNYSSLYKKAENNCWLICVPQSGALDFPITKEILEQHVLKPSPFLQGVYETAKSSSNTVEVDGSSIKTLEGFSDPREANVIFEELFYNRQYKPYRVLCIDVPLAGGSSKPKKNNFFAPSNPMPEPKDFSRCMQYLFLFPENEIVLRKIDEKLQKFSETYFIVKGFERDTHQKLEPLVEDAIEQLLCANVDFRKTQNNDHEFLNISLIIENYVMFKLYHKIILEYRNFLKKEDVYFNLIRNYHQKSTPKNSYGFNTQFINFDPKGSVVVLEGLSACQTPLQMMYILDDTVDFLANDLERQLSDSGETLTDSITTDDLIPLIALVITNTNYQYFESAIFFVENFIFTDISTTKLMFNFINFKAALSFLRDQIPHQVSPPEPEEEPQITLPNSVSSPNLIKSLPSGQSFKNNQHLTKSTSAATPTKQNTDKPTQKSLSLKPKSQVASAHSSPVITTLPKTDPPKRRIAPIPEVIPVDDT